MTPDVRHQHLIVRAEINNPPMPSYDGLGRLFPSLARHLVCKDVRGWLKELISDIKMKIMHGPKAEYCTVEGNRGLTAFAIIETSHLVLHTWDEGPQAILQLDVYTCSDLNVDDVLKAVQAFNPTKVEWKFLDREHDLKLLGEQAA
jgi:S-adenosylmethionine/arginine decarboxylase-like enzyme